ncbi:NADH-quinone oxidoreductase subunit 5 family protein [Nocardia uniformis]|nr:proton-conducting transporter membrane subunit [Nocardia uniformis]
MIALPAVAGVALLLGGRRVDRFAPGIALLTAVATAVLAVLNAAERPAVSAPFLAGIPVSFGVDGLSAVLIVAVAVIVVAVLIFALGDLGSDEPRARFHGLMLLFAAAMLATVTARSLLPLLMAWELMGAASYALIGFRWREAERTESGLVAFLTTRTCDLGLYIAAGAALAGGAGVLALDALADLDSLWLHVAAAGVLLAALGKSAQLPFSFWLSRAMVGPSPVSALLHSATMVAAGAYLLLRSAPLLDATGWAATATAWIGVGTAIALGAVAVCQSDLKQLLAASTSAQVGFMVLAAGVGGVAAGSGHLVAHAVTKSLLFLTAGAWLTALGTRSLAGLRGVARSYPLAGVAFTVGALALAGVPPFALWPTKDAVLTAARDSSVALYAAGFAAALLSAVYAGRALTLVWLRPLADTESHWDSEEPGTRSVNSAQAIPLVALAVLTVAAGGMALPVVHDRFAALLDHDSAPAPGWSELVVSGGVAVTAVSVVALLVRRRGDLPAPAVLAGWLGLETAARRLLVKPVLATARTLARFDDRVLSAGVDTAGTGTRALAGRLANVDDHALDTSVGRTAHGTRVLARRLADFDDHVLDAGVDTGTHAVLTLAEISDRRTEHDIDATIRGIAAATRQLGRWARRPQTGLVHQYYAQATIGIAVLAVVLLLLR